MSMGTTTSIRMKPYLRQELQVLSADFGHGMSWIIEKALEEYIKKHRKTRLIREALEDIKFLKTNEKEDTFWGAAYDDSEWV